MKAVGLLACTVTLLAACGSETEPPPTTSPDAVTVSTGDTPPPRFIPQVATVAVGGTVTFRNGSPFAAHDVKSGTNLWPLRSLQPDESFDVTFTEAGQYQYECTLHPGMIGVIAVQ